MTAASRSIPESVEMRGWFARVGGADEAVAAFHLFRRDRKCLSQAWGLIRLTLKTNHQAMFKEFKEFALKGNLIEMAVAFVMGAAFTKLSTAFIEDLIMPFVGLASGGVDFSNKFIALSSKVTKTDLAGARGEGAIFAYGNFITVTINFVIVAFVMFLVVKAINKAKKLTEKEAAAAPPAEPSAQEKLLSEIRDLLKSKA
jgi:large conductance mechanosensitive channel